MTSEPGKQQTIPDPARRALISPTGARRRNSSHVLRTLYALGPLSRAELAAAIGATRATIGQIVEPLVDSALIEEQPPLPSSDLGGRRARPLWFSRHEWTMAGVHLLPGAVHAAVMSAGGEVFTSTVHAFNATDASPDLVVNTICAALQESINGTGRDLRAIGVAVPGMVDTRRGEVVAVNLMPRLAGLALEARVAERMSAPVYIDHHPRAQALGDLLFGQGRGISSFVSLYTGEALGAGIIIDGSLHRGSGGSGGEVGHTLVDRGGARCHCGRRGCWETIATTTWMSRRAEELGMADAGQMTTSRALEEASADVTVARTLLGEYRRNLAYGIADLHLTLAPQAFLLHGDVTGAGEDFRAQLEDEVVSQVTAHPAVKPRVVLVRDDDFGTVRGAAAVALFHYLQLDV